MSNNNVGDWSSARLSQFVKSIVQQSLAQLPGSMTLKNVTSSGKVTVNDEIELSPQAIAYIKSKIGAGGGVSGTVDSSGGVVAGTGFTCNNSGTGIFDVTFSPSLAVAPVAIVVTANNTSAARICVVSSATLNTSGFTVKIRDDNGTFLSEGFSFIAVVT